MTNQKIGYCYYINMPGLIWDGKTCDSCLYVDVLFDNNVAVADSFYGIFQYLRVYIDIDTETLRLDITENEYFDRVKVDQFMFSTLTPYMDPQTITAEDAGKMVKAYCQQIQSGTIDKATDLDGEQCAYWTADTY